MSENQDRVMAGIVLYNADYDRMIDCLRSLYRQVERIIIYDNSRSPLPQNRIESIESSYNSEYIFSAENLGMAGAMNKIMELAEERRCEWVLTMNADSIVPPNMIETFRESFSDRTIGIVCPQIIDKRRKYMSADPNKKNEYVSMCITSGACTRVKAWRQAGGFDTWLFVDLLDNDISKRMILNGWKIYQVNSIILDQEFGEITAKSKRAERFWLTAGRVLHNDNFAKFSYRKIVRPNRVYYTCRNIVYLNKKYKNYGGIGYEENYNCKTFAGFLICFVLPSILRATKKRELVKAVVKGFQDGRSKKVEPWVSVKHTGSNYHE